MTISSVQNFPQKDNLSPPTFPDYAIYVACLASYNDGRLHGTWIDADQPTDAIFEEIQLMLASSPIEYAEEWAIHDYSGFDCLSLSEYENIDKIVNIVAFLKEHEPYGCELLAYTGNDIEEATQYAENYQGEYDDEEAFAQTLMEECMEVPEHLIFYIDYEKFARDLFISDYFSIRVKGSTFVFRYH